VNISVTPPGPTSSPENVSPTESDQRSLPLIDSLNHNKQKPHPSSHNPHHEKNSPGGVGVHHKNSLSGGGGNVTGGSGRPTGDLTLSQRPSNNPNELAEEARAVASPYSFVTLVNGRLLEMVYKCSVYPIVRDGRTVRLGQLCFHAPISEQHREAPAPAELDLEISNNNESDNNKKTDDNNNNNIYSVNNSITGTNIFEGD